MAKKRTKKEKQLASTRHVNTQLNYKFTGSYNQNDKKNDAENSNKNEVLGSIKKELFKSLTIAILILISLVVIYCFSN